VWIDAVEVRRQIDTLLIQQAAITTALIADLAVNNAKISDLNVGKLTAGTLSADVVVGARLKTADTGARAELNSGGFGLWNSAGVQTVAFAGADGSVNIIGQLRSGPTGKRIEINPTSTNLPEIRFYPDSGSNYGFLNAFSPTAGSSIAYVGLNSGQFTQNNATVASRLYMTDVSTAIESVRADNQQRWGPFLDLSEHESDLGWRHSDGTDRGHFYAGNNFAEAGCHSATTGNSASVFFDSGGHILLQGRFLNSFVPGVDDAVNAGSANWTSATGFTWSYGTTLLTTMYPLLTLYYTGASQPKWWCSARSTTGFAISLDISISATMNWWNIRM
jgi:hypothetical protein